MKKIKLISIFPALLFALIFVLLPSNVKAQSEDVSFLESLGKMASSFVDGVAGATGGNVNNAVKSFLKFFTGPCPNTAQVLSDNLLDCWSCRIFSIIFDAINDLSYAVFEASKTGFMALLAVLLALWILYQVAGHISSFVPEDPEEFWTKMGKTFLKAIVAFAFLSLNIAHFTGVVISPIIIGASEFSTVVVRSFANERAGQAAVTEANNSLLSEYSKSYVVDGKTGERWSEEQIEGRKQEIETMSKQADYLTTGGMALLAGGAALNPASPFLVPVGGAVTGIGIVQSIEADRQLEEMYKSIALGRLSGGRDFASLTNCTDNVAATAEAAMKAAQESGDVATLKGALNPEIKASLMCMVKNMQEELSFGISVGSSIMCYSKGANHYLVISYPDIPTFLAGAMIWLASFLLLLIFTFKLLDACLRLGVLSVLLPLLIVCWVFPSTSSYARQGFKSLVHIVMMFVILAIILALAILLVMMAFQGDTGQAGVSDIRTLFYLNNVEELSNSLNLSGSSMLIALACFVFAILIVGIVDNVSLEFSSVADTGFGTTIGDRMGSAAGNSLATIGQASASLVTSTGKKLFKSSTTEG